MRHDDGVRSGWPLHPLFLQALPLCLPLTPPGHLLAPTGYWPGLPAVPTTPQSAPLRAKPLTPSRSPNTHLQTPGQPHTLAYNRGHRIRHKPKVVTELTWIHRPQRIARLHQPGIHASELALLRFPPTTAAPQTATRTQNSTRATCGDHVNIRQGGHHAPSSGSPD